MKRKFPTRPILGVGGVVLRRNAVLLIQRGKPPMQGQWTLPGGVVELGETLQDAVKREIKEETNLEVRVGPLLELFERIQLASGRVAYHYIIADYYADAVGGKVHAGSDVRAARFVPRTQLADYHLTDVARRVIAKAFALRRKNRAS